MPRLNKVSLIGHVGQNPEFHNFQNGNKGVSISVATDDSYRASDGEIVKRTEWHRIAVYGQKLVETVEKLHTSTPLKGAQVFIEGKLRTRSWEDQENVKRYTTEVIVSSWEGFQLLGKKANGTGAAGAPPSGGTAPASDEAPAAPQDGGDVPF